MLEPYKYDGTKCDIIIAWDTKMARQAGCVFNQTENFAAAVTQTIPPECMKYVEELNTGNLKYTKPRTYVEPESDTVAGGDSQLAGTGEAPQETDAKAQEEEEEEEQDHKI